MKFSNNRHLFNNLISLSTLQGANFILPLITLPYLVRVLGPDVFGLLAVAFAFAQYLVIFTDYGFNYTATRKIAIFRTDIVKLSQIFSSVMLIKLALMMLSALIMTAIIFAIPRFRSEWAVFAASFVSVVGNVLFPTWFYQGMERMKYILLLTLIAKVITTLSIFLFVHQRSDYVLATIVQSSDTLIAGILSIWIVLKEFSIRFRLPIGLDIVKSEFKEGGKMFTATLAGNVYGQGAVIVCGLIAGETAAGYYSIAQRISMTLASIIHPVAQTFYPLFCTNALNDMNAFQALKKKAMIVTSLLAVATGSILFLGAGKITLMVSGRSNIEIISLLKVFAFIIMFQQANVILSYIIMALNNYSALQRISIGTSLLFLVTSFPAVHFAGVMGMAFVILVLVELYVFFKSLYIIRTIRW